MKKLIVCLASLSLLLSCSNGSAKKVLIMSKGKADVDKSAKTITVENSTSHEEQTVDFSDDGDLALQVTTSSGKMSVDIPSNGYYVLNAKTDTLVGSYQNYSAPQANTSTITQEDLKHRIDSLQQLLAGNASAASKNYYILPGKAVKITDNMDAILVGPYNSLTSLEQVGDKAPEVYKFYTTKDMRETVQHLQELTVAPPSPNQ